MPGGYGVTISALTRPAHSASGSATDGREERLSRREHLASEGRGVGEQAGAGGGAAVGLPGAPAGVVAKRGHQLLEVGVRVAVRHVEHDVERVGRFDGDAVVVAQRRLELVAADDRGRSSRS